MVNIVDIAIEIQNFHTKMNGIVFHVVFDVVNRKQELCKTQQKNFINRLKHAELKKISICVDVYKIYEGNDYDKLYEVLGTLKKKTKNE